MIVDFEHHYIPREIFFKHGGKSGEVTFWYEKGLPKTFLHDGLHDVEEHLRNMDAAGIDVAVFTAWATSLEECQFINDDLSRLQKEYPKRIVGLVHTEPLRGKKALKEIERGIKDLGLRGVAIEAQVEGKPLDSPRLWKFYEKVQELGVPIFVHPSTLVRGFAALKAPYDIYRTLGRELDLMTATTRLILGGVLDSFPELKIVVAHMGGGIAAVVERMHLQEAEGHLAVAEKRTQFRQYLGKLYFDMAGARGGRGALQCALTALKPEQLVFATDYPQNFYNKPQALKEYIGYVRSLTFPAEAKEGMLGGNAAKLLGL